MRQCPHPNTGKWARKSQEDSSKLKLVANVSDGEPADLRVAFAGPDRRRTPRVEREWSAFAQNSVCFRRKIVAEIEFFALLRRAFETPFGSSDAFFSFQANDAVRIEPIVRSSASLHFDKRRKRFGYRFGNIAS